VVHYAPDVDLALLEILGDAETADFFADRGGEETTMSDSTTSTSNSNNNGDDIDDRNNSNNNINKRPRKTLGLELAEGLPALQESVHVVGFPTGGKTICITEGVVSRIDFIPFSAGSMLAIQIDAAINPGNR
jgi:hypothetical protein